MENLINIIISYIFLIIAAVTDCKTGKIKNWLTLPVFLLGFALTVIFTPNELPSRFITVIVLFALGCIGVSGWGDIKCVMALAALNNWKVVLIVYILAQLLLIAYRLCIKSKSTLQEIKNQIMAGVFKVDKSREKHIFAPYLLTAYTVISISSLL